MIVFNEGTPGAGKSYDAVVTHILPALKEGRQVFARLNGLDVQKIAAHLKMQPEDINLRTLDHNDVQTLYDIVEKDALVVVDEAHLYWVSSRNPLTPEWETFFAEHRHQGLDIVLISQWYKRLHTAVRARVERKVVFTKLTAMGFKNSYVARFYTTVEPDKYEKTGAQTRRYDKAIFPLYKSVEAGTENLEVYDRGGRSVWFKIGLPAVIVIPVAIWGILHLLSFFTGGVEIVPQQKSANVQQEVKRPAKTEQATFHNKATPAAVLPVVEKEPDLPAGPAYVFAISKKDRPRLAAWMLGSGKLRGVVEWRGDRDHVTERLTFDGLREMGFEIRPTAYGAMLTFEGRSIVVTEYPTEDQDGRVSQSQLSTLRPVVGAGTVPASLASRNGPAPGQSLR